MSVYEKCRLEWENVGDKNAGNKFVHLYRLFFHCWLLLYFVLNNMTKVK